MFCAAYQGAFSGQKKGLLTRARALDPLSVPLNQVGMYLPTSMSQVAGHEALRYLIKRGGLLVTPSMDSSTPPPSVELNDVTGGEDGIFLSRIILTPTLSMEEATRERELRDTAMIFLSMRARADHPISTTEEPLMVFGASDTPIHQLKRGDTTGAQFVSLHEMESLSDQDAIIGVEVMKRNGTVAVLKYKVKLNSMTTIARKVSNRCKELAKSRTVNLRLKRSPSRLLHLSNSCDRTFRASYCLIAGINSDNFKSELGDGFMQKLRRAVEGVKVKAGPNDNWMNDIKNKRRKQLKMSNMGWWASPREKAMILIKLAHPIECGITMEGGKRIYERVNVSPSDGGEWLTRQFITDVEAKFFMDVENRVKAGSPVNVTMGGGTRTPQSHGI